MLAETSRQSKQRFTSPKSLYKWHFPLSVVTFGLQNNHLAFLNYFPRTRILVKWMQRSISKLIGAWQRAEFLCSPGQVKFHGHLGSQKALLKKGNLVPLSPSLPLPHEWRAVNARTHLSSGTQRAWNTMGSVIMHAEECHTCHWMPLGTPLFFFFERDTITFKELSWIHHVMANSVHPSFLFFFFSPDCCLVGRIVIHRNKVEGDY